MKHRLEIQFDGTNYHGWQFQTNAISIQEMLNKALVKIYKEKITTMGSGRTDAKVHALKYYVFYEAPFEIELEAIVKGLNSNLPDDIRVLSAHIVDSDIHATIDAKNREYRYYFSNQEIASAFQVNYIANVSYQLNFEKMQKACKAFVGTYDFASFQTTGSDVKTTVRTIFECELCEAKMNSHPIFPNHYYIRVVGSGFLKQMVRLMVGAIWEVGRGKIEVEDIQNALTKNIGYHIAAVAPAQGLYKFDIQY